MRNWSTEWLVLAFCLIGFAYSLYSAQAAWGWRGVAGELALLAVLAVLMRRFDNRG